MSKYKKFKKIGQFKDAIHAIRRCAQYKGADEDGNPIYDDSINPEGKVICKGTVKIHGSNASLTYDNETQELTCGKRTSAVGVDGGHFGFADWVYHRNADKIKDMFQSVIRRWHNKGEDIIEKVSIFGEWAGKGIQGKVAVAEVDKFFCAFAIYIHEGVDEDGENVGYYINDPDMFSTLYNNAIRFYNAYQFPTYEVEVDLQYPQLSLVEFDKLTLAVEEECPVGRFFGVDKGIGEGIVWRFGNGGRDYWFKTKGEKHSKGGGGAKKADVDPVKVASIKEFVDFAISEDRLEQAYDLIKQEHGQVDRSHTGDFIRWINNDAIAEEGDALDAGGLERSDVGAAIAYTSRVWLHKRICGDLA
tara:strand:+ start:8318 stop:9397 length:1080 start_codon:yes stop_codon:yes gene_type:complete